MSSDNGLVDEYEKFESLKNGIKEEKKEEFPPEVKLINKVRSFVDKAFSNEKKRAMVIFKKQHRKDIKAFNSPKYTAVYFFSWFLLDHRLPNNMTQMAFALSDGCKYFSKNEIKKNEVIKGFSDQKGL